MKYLLLLFFVLSGFAWGQEPMPWGSKWYWASVAATAGGSGFDAGTSVYLNKYASPTGIHESNPLLGNAQGQFVPQRGIAAKVIVLGVTVGCERTILYLAGRQKTRTSGLEKAFAWINVGLGAGYTGIAAHNMTLH